VNSETVRENNRVNGDAGSSPAQTRTANDQNAAPQFNWITERSACSLPKVFAVLRSQLEQDVNTRNSLRPKYAPYEFSIGEDTNAITVRLDAKELHKSVVFTLGDHAIAVRDDQAQRIFDVTVSFDDAGRCRLKVNGEEREFWQVRRMALEDLMFRGL
jgi:hypothetical protein